MASESITIFRGDTSRLNSVVPIAGRVTPAFFEQEREKIFRRAWLPVVSASELDRNGSYVVTDVPPLKASLIVVRGEDGVVRAFHNICRHRGDRLIHPGDGAERGCRRAFTCGFHAWTYSNTGRLIGVTDEGQFRGLDKEQFGLLPVHAEVWEDLVFVNFDPEPRETLREWLGDMHDQYAGYFAGRQKIADHRIVLKTNWNFAVNAFCEGYHNLYIHKNTVPDYQGSTGNKQRHRPYIEVGRNFGRYSAHANRNHKRTPAEAVIYAHSRPLFPSFPPVDVASLPPGVNPSRFEEWAFDIVHVVPNFVFGPQASGHSYMWFWPIDHEHTDIRVQRFAFASDRPSDHVGHAYSKVRFREVLREDLATMEAVHAAVATGALPHIILSQQELLIQNHYRAADDMLARN
jgi:Rieske 2Fe-2S family protein